METRRKLVLIVSLILIFGFFTTSIVSYLVSIKSLRTQIRKKELPLTSDNVYSEVQNDLLKPIFISSLMASDTFLRDWIINGEENNDLLKKYLKEIETKYGIFTSFFVSENTKNYYYYGGILKKIKENEERDLWYYRVKEMKEDYEINVDMDMVHDDSLAIFINYKVYDYHEKYIGVAGVGLQVDTIKKYISDYQEKYNSKIYFIDKNGNVKLSSSNERKVNNIKDILKSKSEKIFKNDTAELVYKKDGKTNLLYSRFIPEFSWYIVVEHSEDNEKKLFLKTLILNLFICLLISLIVVSITNAVIKKYQNRLEILALTDKLTGFYNRQAFDIMAEKAIVERKKYNKNLSLIIFDIDDFKMINDRNDHLVGDEVIKEVSKTVKDEIQEAGDLFRWGGDEFMIILDNFKLKDAYKISEDIRKAVEKLNCKGQKVTLSLGVAEYFDDEKLESILKRVDDLMYKSKEKGKNRTEK